MPDTPEAIVARILERHRQPIINLIDRRMPNGLRARYDAEDVLQVVYETAVQQLQRGGGTIPPRTNDADAVADDDSDGAIADESDGEFLWLYGLARDALYELWRRSTAKCRDVVREQARVNSSSHPVSPIDSATGPRSALLREEVRDLVIRVLDSLPRSYREVLVLKHFEDMTFPAISAAIRISAKNAATRYYRAEKAFREQWSSMIDTGTSR